MKCPVHKLTPILHSCLRRMGARTVCLRRATLSVGCTPMSHSNRIYFLLLVPDGTDDETTRCPGSL